MEVFLKFNLKFLGILNEKRPYTFIRGCATDIFAVANIRVTNLLEQGSLESIQGRLPPAEIDFLHRADVCLALPIQELWPELFESSKLAILWIFD